MVWYYSYGTSVSGVGTRKKRCLKRLGGSWFCKSRLVQLSLCHTCSSFTYMQMSFPAPISRIPVTSQRECYEKKYLSFQSGGNKNRCSLMQCTSELLSFPVSCRTDHSQRQPVEGRQWSSSAHVPSTKRKQMGTFQSFSLDTSEHWLLGKLSVHTEFPCSSMSEESANTHGISKI